MQLHIVGAQNTGKTYLISRILEQFGDSPFFPPIHVQELSYRQLARAGKLAINKSGTIESQREILNLIISDIVPNPDQITIVDRCPLDNLGYTRALQWKALNDGTGAAKAFRPFIKESTKKIEKFYSTLKISERVVIAYLPICGCVDVPLVERENRELSDDKYRHTIDEMLFSVVHDESLQKHYDIRILSGSIAQKMLTIRHILWKYAST
jgi:hypothetical protein